MVGNIDYIYLFITFLIAAIVKDFYDIFISNRIRKVLTDYKILIKKNIKVKVK